MALDVDRPAAAMRVLIVEDDGALGAMLQLILEHDQFQVPAPARSGRAGLEALARGHHDVAIVDLELPDMDGVELLAAFRRRAPSMRLIVCSAHPTDSVQMQQARGIADGVIGKLDLTRAGVLVREVCARSGPDLIHASLDDQLDAVWTQYLPETVRRVEQLCDSVRAMQRGVDDPAMRAAAIDVAHQVRGLAATYDRPLLVDIARTAERLLRSAEADAEQARELVEAVRQFTRAAANVDLGVAAS